MSIRWQVKLPEESGGGKRWRKSVEKIGGENRVDTDIKRYNTKCHEVWCYVKMLRRNMPRQSSTAERRSAKTLAAEWESVLKQSYHLGADPWIIGRFAGAIQPVRAPKLQATSVMGHEDLKCRKESS